MAEKKKVSLVDAGVKELGKDIGKFVDLLEQFVPDQAKDALCSTKKLTVKGARQTVGIQRKAFKATLGVLDAVHKQAGKAVEKAITQNEHVAVEAKDVVKEWSRVMKVGRDELKTAVEKSFDLIDKYLARAEKSASSKKSVKKSPKRNSVKAAPKKKPAPKKKAAAKAKKPVRKARSV